MTAAHSDSGRGCSPFKNAWKYLISFFPNFGW